MENGDRRFESRPADLQFPMSNLRISNPMSRPHKNVRTTPPRERFVRRYRRKVVSSIGQVATVIVLASACTRAPAPLSEAERAAVRDTVAALFNACVDEEKLGNPDVCLGQMSRDPDFRYFVNTTLSLDADSITARTRRGFANRERWEMDVALDTVAVLAAGAAVVTATLRVTTKDIGGPLITRPASWTLVYARRESGWSIIHGHWTYGDAVSPES